MTTPRNASASVWQRLLNRSRSERWPFNELLQYFAMGRVLDQPFYRSDWILGIPSSKGQPL